MTTELDKLKAKVAEAVARRDAAHGGIVDSDWMLSLNEYDGDEYWSITRTGYDMNGRPLRIFVAEGHDNTEGQFIAAHHADIETMQALMVRLEALEEERAEVESKLTELLMCVAQKHEDESRFDTAKRLILRSEESFGMQAKQNDQN